jgi:hypothetical protein
MADRCPLDKKVWVIFHGMLISGDDVKVIADTRVRSRRNGSAARAEFHTQFQEGRRRRRGCEAPSVQRRVLLHLRGRGYIKRRRRRDAPTERPADLRPQITRCVIASRDYRMYGISRATRRPNNESGFGAAARGSSRSVC